MLPVKLFWKAFGIFSTDMVFNDFYRITSAVLLSTCFMCIFTPPRIICEMDKWCSEFSTVLKVVCINVVAVTTLLSRIAMIYNGKVKFLKYKAVIDAFESYTPTSPDEKRRSDVFCLALFYSYLALTLPVYMVRLGYIYVDDHFTSKATLIVYFLFTHVQNFGICCMESHFVLQCYNLYMKFHGINQQLCQLKTDTEAGYTYDVHHKSYPFDCAVWSHDLKPENSSCSAEMVFHWVQTLRIKHWLIRDAVVKLNDLFEFQLGLSMVMLGLKILFYVYNEIFYHFKPHIFIYVWLFQFSLRIVMITVMADKVTVQVGITNLIIASL